MGIGAVIEVEGRTVTTGTLTREGERVHHGWYQPWGHVQEYHLLIRGNRVGEVYPGPYEEFWYARMHGCNANKHPTRHQAMTYVEALCALEG